MPKLTIKDLIMFLKIFGISSLFFIALIIICFIGEKTLFISWPAYVVIVSLMIIAVGIIVLIIETIIFIKTRKKNKKKI